MDELKTTDEGSGPENGAGAGEALGEGVSPRDGEALKPSSPHSAPNDAETPAKEDSSEAVILAAGLTKRYGRETVVDNLDLRIERGDIFGFLGPNGAGKTTTLLMFLGLTLPSAGSVRVLGEDPVKEPLKVKSQVGYLAENMGFYGDLTAYENLSYVCELNKMRDYGEKVEEVLGLVGLSEVAGKLVSEFSRGMRQRLGLAEVLVKDPKVVFLDEPTLGLDPDGINTMLELITRLPGERGLTVILSSHLLYLVSKVATRVGILKKGKLLAQGSIAELAGKTGLEADLEAIYTYYFRGEAA
ncbi:MAG: ABC transporter ATP-binding protein [Deltaproteobacteria bacterium]|jgi:ABC-2 type transport system ATP-binding protein|nr:ABC transporter ATP-binding protein [Deltaproteobacteria bacterium]